jgi:AcrR family transcriptional regulator
MRDGSETRKRIEAEALRLFAEKGVDSTSIRDIAMAVGVSEGALYRHTKSKEELARRLFEEAYADLAREILEAAPGQPFAVAAPAIIDVFCRLFDSNRSLFAFLLLAQHGYLAHVSTDARRNVVAAVKLRLTEAIGRGDVPAGDPEELTAMALGVVAQPAIFILYGRLPGPLGARAGRIAAAVAAVCGVEALGPVAKRTRHA